MVASSALTEELTTNLAERNLAICCTGQGYNYCRSYYWANCCRSKFCCSNCSGCSGTCDPNCDYFSCAGYKNYYDRSTGQLLPTGQPTRQPSSQPTRQPSEQPTRQPTGQPTGQPSNQPSRQPSTQPTGQPSGQPSSQPTHPTAQPTPEPKLFYIYLTDKVDFSQPDVYIGFSLGVISTLLFLKSRQWCHHRSPSKVDMAPPEINMKSVNPS